MYMRQKQVMDSFVRVGSFLDAHPATGRLTYASAREMLDDVVQRLRTYAGEQFSGHALSRAEVRRQADQVALLCDEHLRPLVTIARAQLAPDSDVGLVATLRMPRLPIAPTKLLAVCDGTLEAVRPHEALFIVHGMPSDSLTRFASARDGLARVMGRRATQTSTHVGARAGLRAELLRGRRAVDRLDAIVRASFRGDEAVLATWRMAKRVHRLPGGVGMRATEVGDAVAA